MTDTTGLERVWGLTGAETDPGKTGYEEGWQAEIPTFQEFNFVLAALDRAKLSFAEKDIHRWQEGINYIAGARVEDDEKTFYCITPHDGTSNPQKPSDDNTNSYWVNGVVFGGLVDAFTNLRAHDGVLIDDVQTRSTDDKWEGNDLTIRNKTNITAYTTSSSSHDNLLFGNVRGKLVVVNVANQSQPDERTITAGAANNSYEIFHEGHQPNVTEVVNALEKNPVDGIMYARRNNTWVEVTTTTVGATPPTAAKGAGASWYNLEDGRLYVDIYDGDSSQWVPASPPIVPELVASGISYDKDLVSELVATQVQQAIDELALRPKEVGRNLLINGCFREWQRGDSVTVGQFGYTADRWKAESSGGDLNTTTVKINPAAGNRTGARISRTSTSDELMYLTQRIEAQTSKALIGKQLTLSGICRLANSTDGILDIGIYTPAMGEDEWGSRLLQNDTLIESTTESVAASTWVPFSFTFTVPTSATDGLAVSLGVLGDQVGDVNIALTAVKLEVGSQATEFVIEDPATNSAECKRYYLEGLYRFTTTGSSGYVGGGYSIAMRETPDVQWGSDKDSIGDDLFARNGGTCTHKGGGISSISKTSFHADAGGLDPAPLTWLSAYVILDAEL